MQSDAKSAFCKKSNENDRPGLHFGGLWGHFGPLWAPNGTPVAFFLRGGNFDAKTATAPNLRAEGGVPINLNGWKAPRP